MFFEVAKTNLPRDWAIRSVPILREIYFGASACLLLLLTLSTALWVRVLLYYLALPIFGAVCYFARVLAAIIICFLTFGCELASPRRHRPIF